MGKSNAAQCLSLPAEGEYYDFAKFDIARARETGKDEIAIPSNLPEGISIGPFAAISPEFKSKYFRQFSALANPADRFAAWHFGGVEKGLAIKIADGKQAQLSIKTTAGGTSRMHFIIVVGKGAKFDCVLESESSIQGKNNVPPILPLHSDIFEVFVQDGASLSLATVQNYPVSDWAFTGIYSRLGRFSKLSHAAGIFGGAVCRMRIENHLEGGHCHADSTQAFFMEGHQFSDLQSSTCHHVPDTQGTMIAKGALSGSSSCAYKGYIKIDAGAKNTITHQSGKALLLSKNAAANMMPALDVENNEVEAGHGAAVGELAEDEMFYLGSRGLSREDAAVLIVQGFFGEMLSKFPSEQGRTRLDAILSSKIGSIKTGNRE